MRKNQGIIQDVECARVQETDVITAFKMLTYYEDPENVIKIQSYASRQLQRFVQVGAGDCRGDEYRRGRDIPA